MSVLTEINGYYRIIISAINSRNSPATNHYLIRELIEANTKLAQSAINLICSERITKISLTLDSPSTPFFYAIQSKNLSRQYLVMPGYCDCHYFAECVLSRCTAFTNIWIPLYHWVRRL
uniref:Uncharacterized protein n=1 Tax=Babesia bovis TaxID=5865 RepID=A7AW55_BABBO|eukprot:XP_001608851.1 hypothetical protein [Babesia bovis T2Bo]